VYLLSAAAAADACSCEHALAGREFLPPKCKEKDF